MKSVYDWQPPGKLRPDQLGATRRVLHFAAQAAANLGRSYLPAPEDYSHISLRWEPRVGAMAGEPVGKLRAALRFDPLEWLLLDSDGAVLAALPLAGQTLPQLEQGIRRVLTQHGLDAARYSLKPPFETEPHPLTAGAAFAPEQDAPARRELAAYYAGAAQLLTALGEEWHIAAPPRCWPHHFDYALLLKLGPGSHEEARSIGLGMSPGDHYYDQPYLYATPWPYPEGRELPALTPPASWHREGWTGAVLRSMDLGSDAGPRVAAHWREARGILMHLLDPGAAP